VTHVVRGSDSCGNENGERESFAQQFTDRIRESRPEMAGAENDYERTTSTEHCARVAIAVETLPRNKR
jgi:hypothetical protein